MSYGETFLNADGLLERKGTLDLETAEGGEYTVYGNIKQFEFGLYYDKLPSNDGIGSDYAHQGIPANAVIQRAYIVVDEAWVGGGTTTLSLGLEEADGTEIDDDGIDAAVAEATLIADAVVECDGALIGTKITTEGFIASVVANGPFTAGSGKLVIEYLI